MKIVGPHVRGAERRLAEAVNSPDVGWVVSLDDPQNLCDAVQRAPSLDTDTHAQMRQNALRRSGAVRPCRIKPRAGLVRGVANAA